LDTIDNAALLSGTILLTIARGIAGAGLKGSNPCLPTQKPDLPHVQDKPISRINEAGHGGLRSHREEDKADKYINSDAGIICCRWRMDR
jgi:hypothetical protein